MQQHSEASQNLECNICGTLTELDPETIQALQDVIQEVLIPMIQQQREDPQSTVKDEEVDDIEYQPTEPFRNNRNSDDSSLQNSILQERAVPYLERLNHCFQLKLQNLQHLNSQKVEFQEKCNGIKEQLNREFHSIMYQIEQQRNIFLNELNNIELVYVMQVQKEETEQENDAKQLQHLSEKLQSTIQTSYKYAAAQQAQSLQRLLMDIENLISNFAYPDQQLGHQHQQTLMRFKLQSDLYLQRFRPYQEPQEERHVRENQIEQILGTLSEKPGNRQSKYLKTYEKQKSSPPRKIGFLREDQGSSPQKSKNVWKDQLLDIFNQKQPKESLNKKQQHVATFSIHKALSMQQQSYIQQKESLLKK